MADVSSGCAADNEWSAAGNGLAAGREGRDAEMGGLSEQGGFFANADFDYEARIVLGAAASGIGDAGLVLATLDRIADGDPQSWFDAWTALAADLSARGDAALGRRHLATASWAFLAAAEYYAKALVFVDGLTDQSVLLPTFREGRGCWEKVVDASQGRFVRVQVPYEGTTLPGYLLRPDATGTARPTLVMTNGSDGSLPGLFGYGGAEVLKRGWNAFVFDGPGQQSMLFERGVPFRYDWEAVLTPVIDYLVARSDVDASALTGYGISQGGYWITRAVAFERRMVAAVADPGVVDVSAGWTVHLPAVLLAMLDSGQKDAFNAAMAQASASPEVARTFAFRAKPYGMTDPFDLFTEVRKYQARDVADRITTPLLILDPADEQFFPGQARQLYDLLPGEKEIIGFSQAQGANFHCQPTGRQLTHTQMLDWLADRLPSQQTQESRPPAGVVLLVSDRCGRQPVSSVRSCLVEHIPDVLTPWVLCGGRPAGERPHRGARCREYLPGLEILSCVPPGEAKILSVTGEQGRCNSPVAGLARRAYQPGDRQLAARPRTVQTHVPDIPQKTGLVSPVTITRFAET
jgi:hypothetical protein